MWSILQRGRVLTASRPSEQLNINAMNKGDLFVALVFYGVVCFNEFHYLYEILRINIRIGSGTLIIQLCQIN